MTCIASTDQKKIQWERSYRPKFNKVNSMDHQTCGAMNDQIEPMWALDYEYLYCSGKDEEPRRRMEHMGYLLDMELPKKLQVQIFDLFMNRSLNCTKTFFQASLHQLQSETSGSYPLLLLMLLMWNLSSSRTFVSMTLPKIYNVVTSEWVGSFCRKLMHPDRKLN